VFPVEDEVVVVEEVELELEPPPHPMAIAAIRPHITAKPGQRRRSPEDCAAWRDAFIILLTANLRLGTFYPTIRAAFGTTDLQLPMAICD
jgi:hypothetical protein